MPTCITPEQAWHAFADERIYKALNEVQAILRDHHFRFTNQRDSAAIANLSRRLLSIANALYQAREYVRSHQEEEEDHHA